MGGLPKRTLGRSGFEATILGFGAMELRGDARGPALTDREAEQLLNGVLDSGINLIDTSIDYGRSEERIGRFIAHRRGEYFLASKCGCVIGSTQNEHVHTAENIRRGVEHSLRLLQTDHLDLVQFHRSLTLEEFEREGALQELLKLRDAGKVRFIGVSGILPNLVEQIDSGVFDAFQIPYSLLRREHDAVIDRPRARAPARSSAEASRAARRPTGVASTTWCRARRCATAGSARAGRSARRFEPHRVHAALHALPPGSAYDHRRYEQARASAAEHRRGEEGPATAGDPPAREAAARRGQPDCGSGRAVTERAVVLSQLGDADAIRLPVDLRSRVEVVPVPPSEPTPNDVHGDVLLMSFGNDAIYDLVERGVRWVHFVGTGIDRVDVPRLSRGRTFTNSRGAVEVPISEWVLAVLLHHEKRLEDVFIQSPPAQWPVRTPLGTLYGKRIALLGLGAIGAGIAARALPFGAEVRALRSSSAASPVPGVELVPTFHALIDGADHLVIAAPLTPHTHHILNARAFERAKPGLHVVNIARGDLIDQDALRDALDRGIVSAASLDAVSPEPLPAGHWLYSHPKVRLSPHISWSWPGAQDTVARIFSDNLRRYLSGQPLANVIDPERGY